MDDGVDENIQNIALADFRVRGLASIQSESLSAPHRSGVKLKPSPLPPD